MKMNMEIREKEIERKKVRERECVNEICERDGKIYGC
jgi:hypothetical protein